MNYKYIYENPSENRQLYMYSDYNGKEFIEAYKKSRNDVLIKCLKKINRTEEELETNNKLLKLSNYSHIKKDEIMSIFCNIIYDRFIIFDKEITNSDLTEAIHDLSSLYIKSKNNQSLNKLKLDNLVKIFETKKNFSSEIQNSFDASLISNEIDEIFHFLFSFIIIKHFISFKSLKYFNTLLKLNDLLIYRFYNMNFINVELLLCAISIELKIYSSVEEDILGV